MNPGFIPKKVHFHINFPCSIVKPGDKPGKLADGLKARNLHISAC